MIRTIGFTVVIFSIAIILFALYVTVGEPSWIQVAHSEIPVRWLAKELDGLKIVQISDIHMTSWMNEKRLTGIVNRINGLTPDIVAITGDYVYQEDDEYLAGMARALGGLKPRMATLTVMGNHDYWSGIEGVRSALSTAKIIELNNSVYAIPGNGGGLYIGGVDDHQAGEDRIADVVAEMKEDWPAMLLAHEPDLADTYTKTGRFFLQLSGHSHGGMVVIPGLKPFYLPRFARKYYSGFYTVGDMQVFTNRGLGAIPYQIRFNCRPEIAVFTLRAID